MQRNFYNINKSSWAKQSKPNQLFKMVKHQRERGGLLNKNKQLHFWYSLKIESNNVLNGILDYQDKLFSLSKNNSS